VLSLEQQAEVTSLLDDLLDLPEERRVPRLRSRRVTDPAVLAEVESLLRAAAQVGGFLAAPVSLTPAADAAAAAEEETSSEAIRIGARLGVWRVTDHLGRGGMGEVYEATRVQGDFEQRVAIKVLQREASAQLERFQAERQILARLDHPGIARLYDGGISGDGRPYMVMEFIEGRRITDYCAQSKATLPERLNLFMQVCQAVAYAHRNLVVHRDLKPSNILVTADGQVKLLDFGIAKPIDAESAQLTATAMTPITPSCAAPEQLMGQPITTATDVYALGLLLFELLTGVHPWISVDTPVLQALRTLLQRPAPLASRTAASHPDAPLPERLLRGDLDAIVAKALRIEAADRYGTADELRSDVQRALQGEPVAARAGARFYVASRLLRRYRWAVAAAAAIFVSLAGGLSVAAWQANRAAIERDAARRDAAREEAVRYGLTRLFRAAIAEQTSQPATAKTMIDGSAQRLLREYHDQPQLAGQIVLTLADLYAALEDVAGERSLLEGFLAEAGTDAEPVAVADARQKLAGIELMSGHVDHAAQLLDQAAAFWARAPRQYAEERLEGLGVRARLQRQRGDLDGAIATSRDAIAQRTALSGHDHRETAILYNSLAITLTAANRLEEALAAYRQTTAIYRALKLGDELDAQIVLGNTGTLELRSGNLREAESLLKAAIDRQRALAGDSAAVAASMGYYGKLLTLTDRAAAAIPVLRNAVDVGSRFAGPRSPVTLQAELFLGEAQLAAADPGNARATLTAAREAALAQYGPAHLLTLRAELSLAQCAAADGRNDEAQDQLMSVAGALRKLGPPGELHLALALQSVGELQMARGDNQAAIATLREAVALREKSHDHSYEMAIVRERLGEALSTQGDTPAAAELLTPVAQYLDSQVGPAHPQSIRARRALARIAGNNALRLDRSASQVALDLVRGKPRPSGSPQAWEDVNSRNNQARALSQSRCTVRSDIPKTRAVSSSL